MGQAQGATILEKNKECESSSTVTVGFFPEDFLQIIFQQVNCNRKLESIQKNPIPGRVNTKKHTRKRITDKMPKTEGQEENIA